MLDLSNTIYDRLTETELENFNLDFWYLKWNIYYFLILNSVNKLEEMNQIKILSMLCYIIKIWKLNSSSNVVICLLISGHLFWFK